MIDHSATEHSPLTTPFLSLSKGHSPLFPQGVSRRGFLATACAGLGTWGQSWRADPAWGQSAGDRPRGTDRVQVLNPLGRVPVSLLIDDSTCLVNLAHFAIPQFHEVFPDRYLQDWRKMPREIPDDFVREFADTCGALGIKGKYSLVPYPACVGWLDRDLPGWSHQALQDSLEVVRQRILPDWDIHPEMVSHTWAVNPTTGRPYAERSEQFMENWGFSVGKSVDELAEYLAFALRILRNVGMPCEGVTTPGGFGNQVLPELAQATLHACRDICSAEIPHYFRHLFTDERSVAPRVQYASGLAGTDPRCVVSIIGCTGDWFGGWDGLEIGTVDQFITADLRGGRLPEIIAREEPAIMVCHWPGLYCNGDATGFEILKSVAARLREGFDNLVWLKVSEIARYWAARELTAIESQPEQITLRAPFATERFTLAISDFPQPPRIVQQGTPLALREVAARRMLAPQTWCREGNKLLVCFMLPRGETVITP